MKVHWIGYKKALDQWIPKTDVVVLKRATQIRGFLNERVESFKRRLSFEIKKKLKIGRRSRAKTEIRVPIDKDVYAKTLEVIGNQVRRHGSTVVYSATNQTLRNFFGSFQSWAYRIYNSNIDFCYVKNGTFFYNIIVKKLTEFSISGDDVIKHRTEGPILLKVFFTRKQESKHLLYSKPWKTL